MHHPAARCRSENLAPRDFRRHRSRRPGNTAGMNDPRKTSFVGRSVLRREDHRLLTGRGQFIADLDLPRMLHAVFVRSPVAHARINAVDLARAASSPEVVYVLSGAELAKILPPVPDTQ